MPAYLLELPSHPGQVLHGGANAVVVFADDAAEAKLVAKAALKFDANGPWANATVTEIAAPTDWADPHIWNFQIIVNNPTTAAELYNVTVQADATNNTVDEIAALLVTALEAAGGAALTPSYVGATNVLTIAAIADNIGDHQVVVKSWPTLPEGDDSQNIPSGAFFGVIVDGGIAGAVLTVTLAADGTVPTLAYYRAVTAN